MRFTSRVSGPEGDSPGAWEVHDLALERLARGEETFLLTIGDPDFDTPPRIREAAIRALEEGRTHYSPSAGEPALRDAIAALATPVAGRPVAAAQVTVFPGAQAALYAVAQCLLEPGDEVIVPEPAYVTYAGVIAATGATMRMVPLRSARRFHLDPDDVAAAITPRTRALLLNFPHNPTGAVLTHADGEGVAALCRRHDLALISDEVYSALTYSRRPFSPASLPGMAERTAVLGSLSKAYAMTGWRCGWAISPEPLAAHLDRLAQCMHFGVNQFVQDAGVVALRAAGYDSAALREEYIRRAELVVELLAGVPGILAPMPESGMFVFADVRGTGLDGKRFCRELLTETGVAVTAGEYFGPSGAGHIRLTLGLPVDKLALACRRIADFCSRIAAIA